jgi:tetratricopeptide (TPR) repeat protein
VNTDVTDRTPAAPPGRDRRVRWVCAALAVAVFAAFGPAAGNGFVHFDDQVFIFENPQVVRGLTVEGIGWALGSLEHSNWHPLTWIAYMLDVQLFGLRPGAHHLVSVLWHAVAAVLLFLLLRRMTGRLWTAAFAAALFALHPLRVESVAWATELKDPLSGCFFMLALLGYASYLARPAPARLLPVFASFAAGLAVKPSLVPLPLVLLLLDRWPYRRRGWELLTEKIPLFALSGAAALVAYRAQAGSGAVDLYVSYPLPVRIANAAVGIAGYLRDLVWPTGLAVFYPHPGAGLPAWKIAAAAALLLGVTGAAVRLARSRPYLAVGWLWYLAMILPVAGIVQIGLQGTADRFTYLPLIGVGVALAWAAGDLVRAARVPAAPLAAAAAAALAALLALTVAQTRLWRDDGTLFRHTFAVTERNWVAMTSLGAVLVSEGRAAEAVPLLRSSAAIMPAYGFTHYALGNALVALGRLDEAIAAYREGALRVPGAAPIHNNLGAALARAGRLPEAADAFRAALRANPGYADAHENLDRVLPALPRAPGSPSP